MSSILHAVAYYPGRKYILDPHKWRVPDLQSGNIINEGVLSLKSFERFASPVQVSRTPCGEWAIPYRSC